MNQPLLLGGLGRERGEREGRERGKGEREERKREEKKGSYTGPVEDRGLQCAQVLTLTVVVGVQ